MRTFLVFCSCFLLGLSARGAVTESAGTFIKADQPALAYMGRIEMDSAKARMGFPGITVRFIYRGPAPTIVMSADSPNCFFNLSCNGWDPVVVPADALGNPVANGVPVNLRANHPDGSTQDQTRSVEHLLAWSRMTSGLVAGKTTVAVSSGDAHGPVDRMQQTAPAAHYCKLRVATVSLF